MITPIEWLGTGVRFLDQTKLPLEVSTIDTDDFHVVAEAIRSLKLRGAPLIGVAAAYGVALAAVTSKTSTISECKKELSSIIDYFAETRPTAVNLFWSLNRLKSIVQSSSSVEKLRSAVVAEAIAIHREDAEMCEKIGKHGATLIPSTATILTHCNAGALATGGRGTAVGVITTAHEMGKKIHVFVDETRPLLQGARLTTWELQQAGIRHTLITDNTAAFLFQQHKIDLVIVGADRIAANGDAANKIGTYNLAVLAHYHNTPLYVAAPSSTIDQTIPSGSGIPIEERHAKEVTEGFGIRTAPAGIKVYSPAFDITPAILISGIITEKGIHRFPYNFQTTA